MADEKIHELLGQISALDSNSRELLGRSLVVNMGRPERGNLVRSVLEGLSDEASVETVMGGVQNLPSHARIAVLKQSAAQLSHDEQRAIFEGMTPPNDTKGLWLIVVCAFAIVLVGSFLALALGMFFPPPTGAAVKPELALSMFTSVVGFLAGLFIPSPANKRGNG